MDNNRERIINEFWRKIHRQYKSIFYWLNHTETAYYYNPKTDSLESDNGFSVKVDLPTENLTQDYIYSLIEQLEGDIVEYYWENYKISL